ncbi:MAG: 50S ribosomal protein L6 [Candidatus Pacebacteria bacterium]|nr:50S ribosomal protein L6 [Candidatus Paceibacterota bacterium]MBP9058458.1 50S ribosomal protein L6 [Candidatus Paceibacterota bacterium]MBP9769934.1 50S ribosomal protein L6 [Candidatus Paceibacterota bacterium]
MSRIGKQIIEIPSGVTVSMTDGVLTVKGSKGELKRTFRKDVTIKIEDGKISFTPANDTILANALWGTYASHVTNMIKGVETPYERKLILEGVGFKGEVAGKDLNLALGFSHPVKVAIPEGITVTAEKGTFTFSGIDKEKVGQFASHVRSLKKPEPYKGKGFRYSDEVIRRKQGKKTA